MLRWRPGRGGVDRVPAGSPGNVRAALVDLPGVLEVRGQGLMIGIVLDRPCAELVAAALDDGLLINVTADSVIRLLPPLVMTEQQADTLVSKLGSMVRDFLASH
jgi:acetylornithine aminotransferase